MESILRLWLDLSPINKRTDLGRDTESLEERSLSGLHTSVTSRDDDIEGSEGTSLGGCSNFVGSNDVPNVFEVTACEHKSDVSFDERKETLVLRVVSEDSPDGPSDHGVLAHQNDTFTTQGLSDLVHLVGTNIIDVDNESRREFAHQVPQLGKVSLWKRSRFWVRPLDIHRAKNRAHTYL